MKRALPFLCLILSLFFQTRLAQAQTIVADVGQLVITCRDSFVLDGSNSSTGPAFEYLWTNSNGDSISTDIITQVADIDTYSFKVSNTLTGEMASDTTFGIVEGRDIPVLSSFSEGVLTCIQDVASLIVEVDSELDEVSILWTGPGIISDPTQSTIEVNQAGRYEVAVTKLYNGCMTSQIIDLESDFLTPHFDISTVESFSCIDSTEVLEAFVFNSDNVSYLWEGPNGFTSDSARVTVGVGGYTLTVTNASNGCSSSTFTSVPTPGPAIIVVFLSDTSVCSSILEIDPTEIQNPYFPYTINIDVENGSWREQDGLRVDSFPVAIIEQSGSYVFQTVDAVTGCPGGNIGFSVSLNPEITADAGPDQTFACFDSELVLNASAMTTATNLSFDWSSNDGVIFSGATQASVTVGGGGTYSVQVTDLDSGCTSIDEVIVDQDQNAPTLVVDMLPISCDATGTTLVTLDAMGGTPPYTFTPTEEELNSFSAGSYPVTLTDDAGCSVLRTILISEIFPLTLLDIALNPERDLQAFAIGGMEPYTYLWNDGTEGPIVFNPESNFTYEVTITDQNGCVVSDDFPIGTTTVYNQESRELRAYPNPTKDYVILEQENIANFVHAIQLNDFQGRSIPFGYSIVNGNSISLDLRSVVTGVYIANVAIGDFLFYQKIVVQ